MPGARFKSSMASVSMNKDHLAVFWIGPQGFLESATYSGADWKLQRVESQEMAAIESRIAAASRRDGEMAEDGGGQSWTGTGFA